MKETSCTDQIHCKWCSQLCKLLFYNRLTCIDGAQVARHKLLRRREQLKMNPKFDFQVRNDVHRHRTFPSRLTRKRNPELQKPRLLKLGLPYCQPVTDADLVNELTWSFPECSAPMVYLFSVYFRTACGPGFFVRPTRRACPLANSRLYTYLISHLH